MRRGDRGRVLLGCLVGAAVVLLVVELALRPWHYGSVSFADPCAARPSFSGGGVDGAVQRIGLDALDGAACRLHTTREELVLSFAPGAHTKPIKWDRATIQAALTAGFKRSVGDAEQRGGLDGLAARLLDRVAGSDVARWLLGQVANF